jgi:ribosomal-protein-alanine N-acetyltransferase
MTRPVLETDRLILRRWQPRDRAPFAALNADPQVRRHFPGTLARAESDAQIDRFEAAWDADGIGIAAAERKADGVLLGMAGLARVHDGPLSGAVEVGWRLAAAHWRRGYATEAAARWLDYGFETLGLPEIVAFTVPANAASQAVMRRLGMVRDPGRDFLHPALPPGHPLGPHVVYAIRPAARLTTLTTQS